MLRTTRFWSGVLLLSTFSVSTITAQARPAQFKGDVKVKGADGTNATGVMYFGGAKVRTELSMDGQNIVLLADPAAQSQFMLMPAEKMYMQMPLGQGPISVPISGPTDPTNPCSGGSGATDCVKGGVESINGHPAVRWDYTSQEGVRTRAWISTRLRFPVKTTDDNGASMELSNIAEGVQPASLFGIPAGYTKMDMGPMGGMAAASGRGARGNSGNPVAAAMANVPPEMAAAMAAAMRGEVPKGSAPRGSEWEKGKGWILSVSIVGTRSKNASYQSVAQQATTSKETYTIKWNSSIPLNHGTPSTGFPGGPGPGWMHLQTETGSREAMATPITVSIRSEGSIDEKWAGGCGRGYMGIPPGWARTTIKAEHDATVPFVPISPEYYAQAYLKIASDLKTYELLASLTSPGKEVRQTHSETQCPGAAVGKEDRSSDASGFAFQFEVKNQPLPASVGKFSGSTRMPMKLLKDGQEEVDATITWTLTPIR